MKMRQLFKDESNWNQHSLANNAEGAAVDIDSPAAVSWCLVGGLYKCYMNDMNNLYKIWERIDATTGPSAVSWNNHEHRTFQDIRSLVEELDI